MGGSGSGYGKGKSVMTEEELKRRHKEEDSDAYLFDVEYEKLKKEREEAEEKYEQAREKYMKTTEELRKEMMNGTASEADVSRFMAMLTDRGVQLQEEQAKMEDEVNKLADARMDVEDRMNELRMKAFGGNTRAWTNTTKDKYEGFKIDNNRGEAKVVEMTPEEYLRRVAFDVQGNGLEDVLKNTSPSDVDKYMRQMIRGIRFTSPSLNYINGTTGKGSTERVFAALFNGYSRIPVMVIE